MMLFGAIDPTRHGRRTFLMPARISGERHKNCAHDKTNRSYAKSAICTSLVFHLVIRVNEIIVVILILIVAELLVSLGEIDVLSARAAANDVGRLDLLHVVLVGLLHCPMVNYDVWCATFTKLAYLRRAKVGILANCV